tara:strand:- start:500 stop:772 length:273 start_codon:yes stop_codon:yes gene_type:complete
MIFVKFSAFIAQPKVAFQPRSFPPDKNLDAATRSHIARQPSSPSSLKRAIRIGMRPFVSRARSPSTSFQTPTSCSAIREAELLVRLSPEG